VELATQRLKCKVQQDQECYYVQKMNMVALQYNTI